MHTMTTDACPECGDLDGCHLRSRLARFRDAVERFREETKPYGVVLPKVVCLCGSTRFKDAWFAETRRLTQQELAIVLGVGDLDPREEMRNVNTPPDPDLKVQLDILHKRKIDLADEILVLNVKTLTCHACGRPCDSTRHPVGDTGHSWSRCCNAAVSMRPYVGESTRSEIDYARRTGKRVRWLEPPPEVGGSGA